jgi:hypothetical protein
MANNFRSRIAGLRSDFADAARDRKGLVLQIKADTAALLLNFGLARVAQSESLRCELSFEQAGRSEQVALIRSNACHLSLENRAALVRMSQRLRRSLRASNAAVVSAVDALRLDFSRQRSAFSSAQRQRVRSLRQVMTEDRRAAARGVVVLMANFRESHRRMAMVQKAELTDARG